METKVVIPATISRRKVVLFSVNLKNLDMMLNSPIDTKVRPPKIMMGEPNSYF